MGFLLTVDSLSLSSRNHRPCILAPGLGQSHCKSPPYCIFCITKLAAIGVGHCVRSWCLLGGCWAQLSWALLPMVTPPWPEVAVQADLGQLIGPFSCTANWANLLTAASQYSQRQLQGRIKCAAVSSHASPYVIRATSHTFKQISPLKMILFSGWTSGWKRSFSFFCSFVLKLFDILHINMYVISK